LLSRQKHSTKVTGSSSTPSLGQLEMRYRLSLLKHDLIGELPLTQDGLDIITQTLKKARQDDHRLTLREVCEQYPVTIAVFLTFSGVFRYSSLGRWEYWAGVWEYLPWPDNNINRTLLGQAFTSILDDHRYHLIPLSRPTTRPWVDPILLHAAIPVECLPNLLEHVISPLADDPDLTLAEISPAPLLKPVLDFLTIGERVAENLVRRCVNLLRHLDKQGLKAIPPTLAGDFGLPHHVVAKITEWLSTRDERRITGSRVRHLRIVYDPYEKGVTVELPAIPMSQSLPSYKVTVQAGDIKHLGQVPLDLASAGILTVPTNVRAPAPANLYEITIGDHTACFTARGVLADEPTFFSPDSGRRLGDGPLPIGTVWVIAPRHLTPLDDDDREAIVEDLPTLPGAWKGLRGLAICTEETRYIRWQDCGGNIIDCFTRPVELSAGQHPSLHGEPVELSLTSASTYPPVYLQVPCLRLPASLKSSDLDRWRIRVRNLNKTDDELLDVSLAEIEDCIEPTDDDKTILINLGHTSLLGNFFGSGEVAVQGPLGQDATLSFAVLPDTAVSTTPWQDLFTKEGRANRPRVTIKSLRPITVQAEGAIIEQVGRTFLLRPQDRVQDVIIHVTSADPGVVSRVTLPWRVTPLEWAIANLNAGSEPEWTNAFLQQPAGNIDEIVNLSLLLRTYIGTQSQLELILTADGEPVQEVRRPSRPGGPQQYRFDLADFAESMKKYARQELLFLLRVQTEGVAHEVVLAALEFDWRVSNLEVDLTEHGMFELAAIWTDISQPSGQRYLLLQDCWRPSNCRRIPIAGDDDCVSDRIPWSDLPPARYRVGFCATQRWRRVERVPVCIDPQIVLHVREHEWDSLLSTYSTAQDWLVAIYAHLDLGKSLSNTPPAPELQAWNQEELLALADLLVYAQEKGHGSEAAALLHRWDDHSRLALCATLVANHRGANVRQVAITLRLHCRYFSPTVTTGHSVYRAWPTLGILHGKLPPPTRQGDLRFAWGQFAHLRDPLAQPYTASDGISQKTPGTILAKWLYIPHNQKLLANQEGKLREAMAQLRKFHAICRKLHSQSNRLSHDLVTIHAVCLGHEHLLRALQMVTSLDSAPAPTRTVIFAYVCAATALIQRFAAWNGGKPMSLLEKVEPYESLCCLCPDLYDYYLVLADVYHRHLAHTAAF
jgi:hypothetical protein